MKFKRISYLTNEKFWLEVKMSPLRTLLASREGEGVPEVEVHGPEVVGEAEALTGKVGGGVIK